MARDRTPRKDDSYGTPGAPLKPRLIALSVAAAFAFSVEQAAANPTGPTVVSGSATFATQGNALNVTNSANAIINWQGFSIGANEITRFIQPSQLSAVLNRVVGAGGTIPQSVIQGVLSSNGHVYLLNPSGVIIGAGARINVAGLIASSLDLSNEDFLAGRLKFSEVPGAGAVQNAGTIDTAPGGRVYLVGSTVENSGIIRSPDGDVVLAAGKSIELVSESAPHVTVRITADEEQAKNLGSIIADSGRIGIHGAIVTQGGVAEASGAVVGPGGEIRLVASKDVNVEAGSRTAANGGEGGSVLIQAETGTVRIEGMVEAAGAAGNGGMVQALGVRVGVLGNGIIDASGETGGGTVLVGGDYQGKNPEVQNSQQTYIGADGVIRADARDTGNGGRVIAWSDGGTQFYGSISARGGANGGDGGFVETSGKESLQAFGRVDVGAAQGKGGSWLLDPTDLNVVAGSGTDDGYVAFDGVFSYSEGPATSEVGVTGITDAMSYAGSVELQATQDINFATSVDTSAAYPSAGFGAYAGRDINLNGNSITVGGALTLEANSSRAGMTPSGFGSINGSGSSLTSVNRAVSLSGYGVDVGNVSANGYGWGMNIQSGAGNVLAGNLVTRAGYTSIVAYGGSVTTGTITTLGGSVYVSSDAPATVDVGAIDTRGLGVTDYSGYVEIYSNGNLTVNGDILTRSTENIPIEGVGSGSVSLVSYGGSIQVNGTIDTSGHNDWGAWAGSVYLEGKTGVGSGDIVANGGSAGNGGWGGWGGVVTVWTDGAAQLGNISTRGGNGGPSSFEGYQGGEGGSVYVGGVSSTLAGSIDVGTIDVSGGHGSNAGAVGYGGGWGGHAGYTVELVANSITAGAITGNGGNGGSGDFGGTGGDGTYFAIYSDGPGPVSLGNLTGRGGSGGNGTAGDGGYGGSGGIVEVGCETCVAYPYNISGSASVGAINVSGGNGGSGTANGGWGGASSYVGMSANALSFASITANGGNGGSGPAGGDGGNAALIELFGAASPGPITGRGGNAGSASGIGGLGSTVTMETPGSVALGGATLRAGLNGDSTEDPYGFLNVKASGGITQSGPINVGGIVTVETAAAGDVLLTNASNFIPTFSSNGTILGAASVTTGGITNPLANVTANGNIVLQNTTASGTYVVNATSGSGSVSAVSDSVNILSASSPTYFEWYRANSGAIGIDQNFFTNISAPMVKVGSSMYSSPITLSGAINVPGTLSLITSGALISQAAGSTLTAGGLNADGGDVVLANAGNSVGVLQGRATNADFQFTSSGNIVLGTADAGNATPGVTSNGYATLSSAGGSILNGVSGGYDVSAPVVQLSASGSIGTPAAPLQARATQLDASAQTGIDLVTNQYNPQMAYVTTLQNLVSGNVNLSAYGGASIQNAAVNYGGDVTIQTASPLEVLSGIDAFGNILLATTGTDANDIYLDNTFLYSPNFVVNVGTGGVLTLGPNFVGPITQLIGVTPPPPPPGEVPPPSPPPSDGTIVDAVKTQVSQTTGEINNSVNFDGDTNGIGDDEKKDAERKLPVCKG